MPNQLPPFTFFVQTQPNPNAPTTTGMIPVSIQEDVSGESYDFLVSVPLVVSNGAPDHQAMVVPAVTSMSKIAQQIWGAGSLSFVEVGRYRWTVQ